MSDPPPTPRPKLSALALAKRKSDLVIEFTAENVRELRPLWTEARCSEFLDRRGRDLSRALLSVGIVLLAELAELDEREHGDE